MDINSGGLFFASSDDTDYLEIFDYDGYNFGISVFDGGYIPLAIEQITDSSHEYLGNHILLAFDEYMDRLVGFMFDENGYYIDDLGSPEDQATINQAEELFGVDLNEDGVQGRNLQEFDTDAYVSSKGITTFPGGSDNKTLITDLNSGEILFASSLPGDSDLSLIHISEPTRRM